MEYSENGNNGHDAAFAAFIQSLQEQDDNNRGDKDPGRETWQLLGSSPQRQSAVHYLATVGKADDVYKKNTMLSVLLDQMARTSFVNREERIAFLDYLEWLKEFEQDYDYALWWVVGAISDGGKSRIDLVAAVTTINQTQRHFNYGETNKKKQENGKDPVIS